MPSSCLATPQSADALCTAPQTKQTNTPELYPLTHLLCIWQRCRHAHNAYRVEAWLSAPQAAVGAAGGAPRLTAGCRAVRRIQAISLQQVLLLLVLHNSSIKLSLGQLASKPAKPEFTPLGSDSHMQRMRKRPEAQYVTSISILEHS
jgi:hypothetical protein